MVFVPEATGADVAWVFCSVSLGEALGAHAILAVHRAAILRWKQVKIVALMRACEFCCRRGGGCCSYIIFPPVAAARVRLKGSDMTIIILGNYEHYFIYSNEEQTL